MLGRLASGERTSRGLLHDRIDVYRGGRCSPGPIASGWRAATPALLAAAAGLGGAVALATFVYAAPDAAALARARPATSLAADGVRAGATLVNGLLVARFLAEDPLALRRAFALFWARFRAAAAGLPPVLPRLWHV